MAAINALARELLACRIIDLSSDVGDCAPGPFQTEIDVIEAAEGAEIFCEKVAPALVPEVAGRLRPDHFPDRAFLRHEMVRASVHSGSHIDAPGHYGPSRNGNPGMIASAPLEAFVGAGVMLDVAAIDGWRIEREHIRSALRASAIEDLDRAIVLVHTQRDKAISPDVVVDLLDAGVQVIGTDAEGFDGPFEPIVRRFLETEDTAVLWPAHVLGRDRPYYHIERLRNLELLPSQGFIFVGLPVLIGGATASWTRAVAFVPEETELS
jgi:cyclase